MSDKIVPSLLTIPIELVFCILDNLDEWTIFLYVRNVCTKLKSITNAYYRFQVNFNFSSFLKYHNSFF